VKRVKTRIAAGVTILGLGGLTGLALSTNHQQASEPVAAKPLVRTKVIRRTIHVTKHTKPNDPAGSSPMAGRAGSGYSGDAGAPSVTTGASSIGSESTSSPSSGSAPVTTSSSGASSTPSEPTPAPVVTHSSGSSSHTGSRGGATTAPVVTHSSGASAGSGSGGGASTPVVTSSSGGGAAGGGESEHESEGGDD